MAEGYLRYFAREKAEIYSAGIETHGVNSKAVAIMQEDGINISHHTSNNIDEYQNIKFDFVITVCDNAKENCPYFPARAKILHYNFQDPAKISGDDRDMNFIFRKVRDEIKLYCENFINKEV